MKYLNKNEISEIEKNIKSMPKAIEDMERIHSVIEKWSDNLYKFTVAKAYINQEMFDVAIYDLIISFAALGISLLLVIENFVPCGIKNSIYIICIIVAVVSFIGWVYKRSKADFYARLLVIIEDYEKNIRSNENMTKEDKAMENDDL